MDTTYGVLCLIPPIVAIGLALWTKQTIFSLFIAVWLGSTMMNGFNPLVGFVKIISDYMIPSLSGNASLIILVTLSGGMIAMLTPSQLKQLYRHAASCLVLSCGPLLTWCASLEQNWLISWIPWDAI
mgnify:CR=1 FL=1